MTSSTRSRYPSVPMQWTMLLTFEVALLLIVWRAPNPTLAMLTAFFAAMQPMLLWLFHRTRHKKRPTHTPQHQHHVENVPRPASKSGQKQRSQSTCDAAMKPPCPRSGKGKKPDHP